MPSPNRKPRRTLAPLCFAAFVATSLYCWTFFIHRPSQESDLTTVALADNNDIENLKMADACVRDVKHSHVLLSEWMSADGDGEMTFVEWRDLLPYAHDLVLDCRLRTDIGHVVKGTDISALLQSSRQQHPRFRTEAKEIHILHESQDKAVIGFEEWQFVNQTFAARIYSWAFCRRTSSDTANEIYLIRESTFPFDDDIPHRDLKDADLRIERRQELLDFAIF